MACYGDMYHSKKEEPNFKNDKKKNAAYWDAIDDEVSCFIERVMAYSDAALEPEEIENLEDEMYSTGVLPEIRDKVIEFLEGLGCVFPYIDTNM